MAVNNQLIATLSDIVAQLARGELVALDASVGHEYPYMSVHRRLGDYDRYVKTGPAVLTLDLRMEQVPQNEARR